MARMESEREDLMRDARALRIRVEFRVAGREETVIAGCRDGGSWSVYFGQDPCYHFDGCGRLRRAYAGGRLYRTQGATLAELRRERSPEATQLVRRDLTEAELGCFLDEVQRRLGELWAGLRSGAVVLLRSVPDDTDVVGRLDEFLSEQESIELAPAIKTRPH